MTVPTKKEDLPLSATTVVIGGGSGGGTVVTVSEEEEEDDLSSKMSTLYLRPATLRRLVATTSCVMALSVLYALLFAALRGPLYAINGDKHLDGWGVEPPSKQQQRAEATTPPESKGDEKGPFLYFVYASGLVCHDSALSSKCAAPSPSLSFSSSHQSHCRHFPLLDNGAASTAFLSLPTITATLEASLACLSVSFQLFVVGRVFNLITHTGTNTLCKRLLVAASAFSFANACLTIAVLHVGQCGATAIDKVVTLRGHLEANLSTAPLYSLMAAIILCLCAHFNTKIEVMINHMASPMQTKLLFAELSLAVVYLFYLNFTTSSC